MKKRFLLLAAVLIICVAALAMPASAAEHADHSGWTELTADKLSELNHNLSTGSYYLSGDVTATDVITINGEVTLCLNGHVLNLNENCIFVNGSGATLTLCDCNSTKQTHKFTVGDDGLWTWDEEHGDEEVTGGVITGGKGLQSGGYYYGGGVCVNGGTFTMESGNIVGNTATYGGGVYVQSGTFIMSGGSIKGNNATNGGGVYVQSGTFNMESGSISGNNAGSGGGVFVYSSTGQLKLSGAPVIKGDIRLGSKLIEITGELSNTEPFQLTNVDSQFTTNWNTYMQGKDPASYFTISTTGYHVGLSSGEVSVLANTYTVTFNSNGGTGTMGNMTFTYDTAQALTKNAFTKTGYTFAGWSDGDNTYTDMQQVKNLTTENGVTVTLYAQWKANVYKVTLHPNEGTINSDDIKSYTYGVGVTLPTDVTRTGYTFDGWYDGNDNPVTAIGKDETGDKEFWAKWTANSYTVVFLPGDGEGSSYDQTFTYDAAQKLDENQFTKTGHSFTGWKLDDSTTFDDKQEVKNLTTEPNGTVTLTAQWEANVYKVTLHPNEGTINSGNITSYTYGSAVTLPTDVERTGYRFDGWYASADFSGDPVTEITAADYGNKEFWAKWTVISSGGGTPAKTPSQQAADRIERAKDGATVEITLKTGQTKLDKEVFEALAGRDVTLEINLPGGVAWTVNGQDIPADANLTDLDMGVSMNTSTIPVDIINAVTGEISTVQLSLAHEGAFGFTLTLSAPLGREHADLWANLYHYDAGALKFQTAARIGADGMASLKFTHASAYAIVIDDHSHALPFTDAAADAWYYDAVDYVYQNGLMTGTSATTFAPDGTMTRAMLVTILHRQAGAPQVNYALPFDDVAEGAWYTEAVRWAASEGIVTGMSATAFEPNAPITREQFAAILYRYAQKTGADVSAGEDTNILSYADALDVSEYAVPAMQWACGAGVIQGSGANLNPKDGATRAEAAAMLMRFCEGAHNA